MSTERCLVPWTPDIWICGRSKRRLSFMRPSWGIATNEDQSEDIAFRVQLITDEVELNDAIKIFDECRRNIQPRKSVAVLQPLATVDPRVPSGVVRNAHQRIKDEWIDTLYLANRVKNANMVCAQNCHSALERLASELGSLMQAKVDDEKELTILIDRRAALEAKISLADRRQHLLDISRGDPIPKQDKWFDAEREGHVWSYGCVDPHEYGLGNEIERHEKVHEIERGFTRQEGAVRLSCGRRKIIGIKVTSNLESYWKFEQTADNDHVVEIRVQTRRREDGKWTLECWSVDPELYKENKERMAVQRR